MIELLEFRKILALNIIEAPSAGDFINDKVEFYKIIGAHNGKMEVLKLLDKFIDTEINNMAAGN